LKSQSAKSCIRFCTLRQQCSMFLSLAEWMSHSYRGSLLRLTLRGPSSCYHRIRFERAIRGTPRFDAVRRCVGQAPSFDSRNKMQFCSRSIRSLEEACPCLTLGDAELFLRGRFRAARCYAHLDSQSGKSEQNSPHTSESAGNLTPRLARMIIWKN
jgi:hypothetical protein